MQDLPTPDMSLPQTQQTQSDDPRLARLQHWQRLQAAQEQINSINRPRASNILGGQLRQARQPFDMEGWLQQSRQNELTRLQLEQLRQQNPTGKMVLQGYVTNRPKYTYEQLIQMENGGTQDLTAEAVIELASWVYGAGEVAQLIKILKQLKIPLKLLLRWLREELKRKRLKESLDELAKASKNSSIRWGSDQAKNAIKRTIRGIDVTFPLSQVKKKLMRHADDIGWPKPFRERDLDDIVNMMNDPNVTVIKGTHRGVQKVYHFYNHKTGVIVIIDQSSNQFISCWRLSLDQIQNLIRTRNVQ